MKNRTDSIRLADGQYQFNGSDHNPNTYITSGYLPHKKQWVITNIDVIDPVPTTQPEPPPDPFIEQKQDTVAPPEIVFTKHAKKVLNDEFLDHRTIEYLMQHPDKEQDEEDGKVRFIGWADGDKIHIIATFLPDENKWRVISAWIRGEEDDGSLSTWQPQSQSQPSASGIPRIVFTKHMRERMEREGIDGDHIEQAILDPQHRRNEKDGKVRFKGPFNNGKELYVIGKFIQEENKWLVITAYYKSSHKSRYKPRYQSKQSSNAANSYMFMIMLVIIIVIAFILYGNA